MNALANSTRKRARESDIAFYKCYLPEQIHDLGFNLVGLAISGGNGDAVKAFRRLFPREWSVWDAGSVLIYDLNITPVGRFSKGKCILYEQFASSSSQRQETEVRIAHVVPKEFIQRYSKPSFPRIRTSATEKLGLYSFMHLQKELLEFIEKTHRAGTYQMLRRELRRQFGLKVTEFSGTGWRRRGYVSVDWVFADLTCDFGIYINRDLDPRLKYIVLAHEIGHFLCHFVFMFAAQLIEQRSWYLPGYQDQYFNLVGERLSDRNVFEIEANWYASYLLVPYWYDEHPPAILRSVPSERGDYEEFDFEKHVWSMLQDLFPETSQNMDHKSWRDLRVMLDRRDNEIGHILSRDINAEQNALYETMLAATLTRHSPELGESFQTAIVERALIAGDAFRLQYDEEAASLAIMASRKEHKVDGRLLIDPLIRQPGQMPRRFPLVPTVGGKLFRSAIFPSERARSIASWQARYPHWQLAIYDRKRLPTSSVNFNPFETFPEEGWM